MIIQRFNLNLIPNQSPVIVHVNQYDTGTGRLIATLYEGNEPYSPSGTAVIQGTKPDGHGFQYSATLDGNVVTADLTEQMSPVAGDVRAQIVVTESSGVTGTFVFIMRVQPSALPSDADMSESDYPLIEEAIREAQEAVIESHDNAENSEAWAQGTRGGVPVGPTDPTYEHNAEYWAHQAEGAASGVSSFNGRSGSVLPIAGDYDSEKILLASALHIGGETQSNVQEALEALVDDGGAGHTILNGLGQEMPQRKNLRFAGANLSDDAQNDTTNVTITGGSGGSTITVTTIETTLYGETVTITDGTSTFTGVFDNSGVCVIDGVTATGTLTVTSGGASRTLNVPYFGNYTVVLSFWAATINVSTDPDVVSAIVKKDGVQIDTISFSAGSGVYVADSTGAYTFTATVGGIDFTSPTVNVTQQTTYNTIIDIFNAILSISTSSSDLYGKTITIKKGSTVVGTTAFSAQGSASYTVHETGTYTCECEGYSGSATVSAETTYSVTINAGLDLSAWITAGSTSDYPLNPSSYADFAALEADEEAIRQLILVHNAEDYLATAGADDTLIEDVINSDICAKWIGLSDYAVDKLEANANIKSVMDEADKYGYGEIGAVNIATDTTKVSASGQYSSDYAASKAINTTPASGNKGWISPSGSSNAYLDYDCGEDVSIAYIKIGYCASSGASTTARYKIQGKKNGSSEWVDLTNEYTSILLNQWTKLTLIVSDTFRYYRLLEIERAVGGSGWVIQYCKYQPLGNVPIMTANNAPYGTAIKSTEVSAEPAYTAFDGDDSTRWCPSAGATNNYIGYEFVNPTCVRRLKAIIQNNNAPSDKNFILQASNDGFATYDTFNTLTVVASTDGDQIFDVSVENDDYYIAYRLFCSDVLYVASQWNVRVRTLQFYGRELTVKQALAPTDGREYIQIGSDYYTEDWGEKEFATGSTTGGTPVDDGNQITVTSPNSAAFSNYSLIQSNEAVNMGDYDYIHVKYGNRFVYDASNRFHLGAWKTKMTGQNYANTDLDGNIVLDTVIPLTALEDALDITQVSATEYPAYYASYTRAAVTASIKELWLE